MKLRKLSVFVLLIAVLSASSAAAFAAPLGSRTPVEQIHAGMFPVGSEQMVDYTHGLFVRRGPFTTYEAFTTLTRGTVVTVLKYRDKWILVGTPRGEGWIYAGYLSRNMAAEHPLAPRPTAPLTARDRTPSRLLNAEMFPIGSEAVLDFAPALFVRSGPGNSYDAIAIIQSGTVVVVLDVARLWVKIDTPEGAGWIFSGFLSNSAVLTARAAAQ